MRAKVIRQLRQVVFGKDLSPRDRKYYHHPRVPGTIIADERRRRYQSLKRAFKEGKFTL